MTQWRQAGLALIFLLGACSSPPSETELDDSGTWTYSDERQALEAVLAAAQARLEATRENRDAAPAAALFAGWMRHARLTGEIGSYGQARTALAALQERRQAPVCMETAQFALATHQPQDAARALAVCARTREPGLQADIAFYAGDYRRALELSVSALNAGPSPDHYARLAQWRLRTGSPQEAAALMEAAERRYHNDNPHQLAWYKLQRGLIALHSGQFERARALYRRSLEALPGWWLAQEHLAEVELLLGNTQAARGLYDTVIEATGYAEFLAARAELDLAAGESKRANAAIDQARAQLEQRLRVMPEAAAGHAVEFFLAHGPAQRARELAEQDYARRPYGEAAILLAEAQLAAGEREAARELMELQLAAGWSTAEAHHLLARIYAALGHSTGVSAQRQAALALNPRVEALAGPLPEA